MFILCKQYFLCNLIKSGDYYGSEYNYDSIMHYHANAFSISSGLKTIEAPVDLVLYAYKSDADILSTGDIKSLRGYYECKDPVTTTTTTATTTKSIPYELHIKNDMRQTVTLKRVQTDGTELFIKNVFEKHPLLE